MIEGLPIHVTLTFVVTTILVFAFLLKAVSASKYEVRGVISFLVASALLFWLGVQGALSITGFYMNFDAMPPRLLIALGPPLIVIVLLFFFKTKKLVLSLPLKTLTYLHVIRIPVELVLFWLYESGNVPALITFEGLNFDILSGITAPFIGYLCFSRNILSKKIALLWNFVALALLINVVGHAILSVPLPFQQFAFDQPNVGVMYFPFIWLPSFIVPAVLFCHIVSIYRLMAKT